MTNKADYIALINSKLPNGSNILATDHRDTMHTNANSIAEVVYSDSISDSSVSQTYTTKNSNFDYEITIFKNANTVTLYGNLTCLVNLSSGLLHPVFDIGDSDLYGNGLGVAKNIVNTGTYNLSVNSSQNKLFINGAILAGNKIEFSITYNALN